MGLWQGTEGGPELSSKKGSKWAAPRENGLK
jgi:hypothetical protein